MRYREAQGLPQELPKDDGSESKSVWKKTYSCTTITPIYGGGVEKGQIDIEMPIRSSAIRGQLRFWWRLLRQQASDIALTPTQLFQQEREIWGGMAEENNDYASQVKIRIVDVHKPYKVSADFYNDINLKYALFSARDTSAQLFKPGLTFTLVVSYEGNEKNIEMLEQSIRWWASFGGVGARTRRGLGAVEIKSLLPVTREEVERYGCQLAQKPAQPGAGGDAAISAWKASIKKLYQFRQGANIGRRAGNGRSYWPEPDSIRELTGKIKGHEPEHKARNSFPRAAFGLPIVFEFTKDKRNEPPKTELTPLRYERMASPLIIKPMVTEKGYVPMTLFLPVDHLDELELKLKELDVSSHKNFSSEMSRDEWWPSDENDAYKKAQYIKAMQNRGHDPLQAFMEFFVKEGRQ